MSSSIFTRMTALAQATGAVNLGQGFPDDSGPSEIVEAAVAALRAGHNQYAPSAGIPALRQAIAAHQQRRYAIALDPDTQVQVTFGATEAIAAALLALLQPGDEVVAFDPTYDSYGAGAEMAGATLRPIVLAPPDWRVTEEALRAAITPRTRVLICNSPHNPTGRVLDRDELALLAAACVEHDLVAVTDEVYEHLVFDGAIHVPLATLPGMAERTLTVSSLGKTHSLTGWKIGWLSGPAGLVEEVASVKQFLSFSGGTPLQHAAAAALELGDGVPATLAASLRERRDRLAAGVAAAGFAVLPTQGTYFLTADASALGEDDAAALCLRLPEEAGVAAIPISALTAAGDADPATRSLVRLTFCKRDAVIDEGISRLARWASARA